MCMLRVALATLADHREEVDERLALAGAVVRPQRPEGAARFEHAPQVLQAPLAAVGGPQRVALEVEEQVALVGIGQQRSAAARRRSRTAACRRRVARSAGGPARSATRRSAPTVRAPGRRGRASADDGGDAGVDQPGALADPHAGHQQQVVVLADLDRAFGTAEACPHARRPPTTPRCRRPGGRRAGAAARRGGAGTPAAARRRGSSRWRRRRAPTRPRGATGTPAAASVSA